MDRRRFLFRTVAAGAALTLSRMAPLRAAGKDLEVTPLGGKLWLISGGGGNVTVLQTPAGVLLVDGGSHERSADVLKAVQQLTGTTQVHTLFNTHWHWDQTGSNEKLGRAGTRIIAHENTRLWLSTTVDSKWEQRTYPPSPAKALPTQTFYTNGQLQFGGEQIEYGQLFQAHTDGDLYVYFRQANVLVAGDVVSVGRYPIIDYCTGGWIGGTINALQTLLEIGNTDTRIVAGVGPVQDRAGLQSELAMLTDLKLKLSKLLAQGMSVQDMIEAAPTRDYDAKWGDPKLFIAQVWPGLVERARDLGVAIV